MRWDTLCRTFYVRGAWSVPIYTGTAGTYYIVDLESIKSALHFQDTALNMSRYETILTSFIDPARTQVHLAAVMKTKAQLFEIWKAQSSDHTAILNDLHKRYDKSTIPFVPHLINQLKDLFL